MATDPRIRIFLSTPDPANATLEGIRRYQKEHQSRNRGVIGDNRICCLRMTSLWCRKFQLEGARGQSAQNYDGELSGFAFFPVALCRLIS
jgi:hypothetical protein